MADATTPEGDIVNNEIENEELQNEQEKEKKHDKAACADLEKITDYEEDKEISNQNIGDAISIIEGQRNVENLHRAAREKELSMVKVKREDIELIINEMEVSHSVAERKLREANGEVVQALCWLTG